MLANRSQELRAIPDSENPDLGHRVPGKMLSQNLWVRGDEGMDGRRGKHRTKPFQKVKAYYSPALMAPNAMRLAAPVTGCSFIELETVLLKRKFRPIPCLSPWRAHSRCSRNPRSCPCCHRRRNLPAPRAADWRSRPNRSR